MTIIDWMNQLLVHKKHWNDFTEDEQGLITLGLQFEQVLDPADAMYHMEGEDQR